MAANLNISIGATIEPLKKAISAVMQTMSQFSQTLGANGEQLRNQIDSAMAEVDQQLKEATSSFENFNAKSASDTQKTSSSMGSLRKEIRQATQELAATTRQFGANSKEAIAAAQKVANLKDEMGDMKLVVDALNPDEKFKALKTVTGNVVGGIQAMTGAMTLFSGESEMTKEAVAKLQALMAITSGLNAIGGLKDAFLALRVQITAATAGMSAMKVVLASTGILAVVAAVGYLAANWDSVSKAIRGFLGADIAAEEALESSKGKIESLNASMEFQSKMLNAMGSSQKAKDQAQINGLKKIAEEESKALSLAIQLDKDKEAHVKSYAKAVQDLAIAEKQYNTNRKKEAEEATEKSKATAKEAFAYIKELQDRKVALMSDGLAKDIAAFNLKKDAEIRSAKESGKNVAALLEVLNAEEFEIMKKWSEKTADAQAAATDKRKQDMLAWREEVDKSLSMFDYEGIKKIGDEFAAAMQVSKNWTAAQGTEQERLNYIINAGKKALEDYTKAGLEPQDERIKSINNNLTNLETSYKKVSKATKLAQDTAKMMNDALKNLAVAGFEALGTAIANAVTGKGNPLQNMFKSMGLAVADFLSNIGKGLIAAALATEAFKKLITNPVAGIAAGVAAIALGQILKSKIEAGPSFAVGSWEIPRDMTANIHKGEMIIPRTFADDIRSNKGFGGGRVAVEGLIYGNNLAVIARKTNNRNMRIRGQWG